MQPKSGYKTVTPILVSNALHACKVGLLSTKGLRVYFACISLEAIREAAKRSSSKQRVRRISIPLYRQSEVAKATGLTQKDVRRELRILGQLGLVYFSKIDLQILRSSWEGSDELLGEIAGRRSIKRPIPIPRSVLRLLATVEQKSVLMTLAVYLSRGLSISRSGEVVGKGSVKASWIAEVCGLSLRSVRSARAKLIEQGVIARDIGSHQRKLNRTGAYFEIMLDWSRPATVSPQGESKGHLRPLISTGPFAPPPRQTSHQIAPPIEDKKTPYGSKDQKTKGALRSKPSGAFRGSFAMHKQPPRIENVVIEDLHDFFRLESLYRQAVNRKWVQEGESSFLNWVASAVRAKTQRSGDPVRIFIGIVRKRLYAHISQGEEERARLAIQKYRFGGVDKLWTPTCAS